MISAYACTSSDSIWTTVNVVDSHIIDKMAALLTVLTIRAPTIRPRRAMFEAAEVEQNRMSAHDRGRPSPV